MNRAEPPALPSGHRADEVMIAMSAPLHVLLISIDETLPLGALQAYGVAHTWQRVAGLDELRAALETVLWDVAVFDSRLAGVGVGAALAAIHEHDPDLQLIVIDDLMDEPAALAALRAGARDVVLRTQPGRLALLTERAADETRERRERRLAESEHFREAARAEALVRSAQRLRSNLDRGAAISVICEETVRALGAELACVALPGADARFEIVGCAGQSQPLIAAALLVAERHLARADPRRPTERGWIILESGLRWGGRMPGRLIVVFAEPTRAPGAAERALLSAIAEQAGSALDNAAVLAGLQANNAALSGAFEAALAGWVRTLDLRDRESEGHTERVTALTVRLAEVLGVDDDMLVHVRRGAMLHDIGQLGVPEHILQKPGPLDEQEWTLVRRHPVYAYEWLSGIPFLTPATDIPYCHHERWDGAGYPRGLRTQDIPLPARIFAVADTWDTLRSARPYKPAYSEAKALQIITAEAGRQLDPGVMTAFLRLLPELRAQARQSG
jgi:HD-GYP domain-containing protein (c-di-GMP phosphodiesterase class II)